MNPTTQAVIGVLVAVIGSGALGTIAAKYFRPNATPIELLNEVKAERETDREEIVAIRQDMRVLTDYVHELRNHIALGLPPPPPQWPEGLRL